MPSLLRHATAAPIPSCCGRTWRRPRRPVLPAPNGVVLHQTALRFAFTLCHHPCTFTVRAVLVIAPPLDVRGGGGPALVFCGSARWLQRLALRSSGDCATRHGDVVQARGSGSDSGSRNQFWNHPCGAPIAHHEADNTPDYATSSSTILRRRYVHSQRRRS